MSIVRLFVYLGRDTGVWALPMFKLGDHATTHAGDCQQSLQPQCGCMLCACRGCQAVACSLGVGVAFHPYVVECRAPPHLQAICCTLNLVDGEECSLEPSRAAWIEECFFGLGAPDPTCSGEGAAFRAQVV